LLFFDTNYLILVKFTISLDALMVYGFNVIIVCHYTNCLDCIFDFFRERYRGRFFGPPDLGRGSDQKTKRKEGWQ
jgi:hypothetical protein